MKSAFIASAQSRRRWSGNPRIVCGIVLLGVGVFITPMRSSPASPSAIELPANDQTHAAGWNFELLPTGFQKNPILNMTVVTEFTDDGRAARPASSESPVYYVAHGDHVASRGHLIAGEGAPPPTAEMMRVLKEVLAQQGFHLADTIDHPPDLALFFSWGSHNAPDRDFAEMFPETAHRSFLERAVLVGGKSFVRELTAKEMAGPWNNFSYAGREKTLRYMYDQASRDIHYVVVSAYAFDSVAHDKRLLLWRTAMTVEGVGIGMADALQPLVLTAGAFVGREHPATVIRRSVKKGTVELGPMRVIDDDVVGVIVR